MRQKILSLFTLFFFALTAWAQQDVVPPKSADVYKRIMNSMANFSVDTTTPPADKVTRKIVALRQLGGGFNINEAIAFKIAEDRQKGEMQPAQLDALEAYFTLGNGYRWLNNASVWIYRKHFTYRELKQLVKFYKSAGGKKMADVFPIVMLQTLAAAETLQKAFVQQSGKR